jgi:formylglycine-generating enzyme required for sulfatase activity
MKLTGQKVQQICDALLDGYPTRDSLRIMVRIELDENLDEIAGGENQSVVIFNLVAWAERNGRVDDLIMRAHQRTPGNEALKRLAAEWRAQTPPDAEPESVSPLAGAAIHPGPASIDVFLSYSRRDGSAMRQVQETLRASGLSVWTDEGLEPGTQNWQDAIAEAVRQADAMVVLLSPNSSQSKWVKNEIGFAETLNKQIFPVLIAGDAATAVPISLINAQWVDGRQNLHEAVVKGLLPSLLPHVVPAETEQVPPPTTESRAAAGSAAMPSGTVPKGEIDGGAQSRKLIVWILGAVLVGALGLFAIERLLFLTQPTVLPPAAMDPTPSQAEATQTPALTVMPTEVEAAIAATQAPVTPVLPTTLPTKTSTLASTSTPTSAPTATWTPIPVAGSIRLNAKDDAEYVYIPAGEFKMGSDPSTDSVATTDEQPQDTLTLPGFWIMRTEVTNGLYKRCVEEGSCTEPNNTRWNDAGYADHPVTDVTWHQANVYAAWAGGRLPTEAEWEKACRGTGGRIYPWGDSAPTAELANYGNSVGDTMPVGKYSPQGDSAYGLIDMAGNVWEWTSSQYQSYP